MQSFKLVWPIIKYQNLEKWVVSCTYVNDNSMQLLYGLDALMQLEGLLIFS